MLQVQVPVPFAILRYFHYKYDTPVGTELVPTYFGFWIKYATLSHDSNTELILQITNMGSFNTYLCRYIRYRTGTEPSYITRTYHFCNCAIVMNCDVEFFSFLLQFPRFSPDGRHQAPGRRVALRELLRDHYVPLRTQVRLVHFSRTYI